MCCVANETMPDGTPKGIPSEETSGMILQQFYNTVQVMIGEATAVSELRDLLRDHQQELEH